MTPDRVEAFRDQLLELDVEIAQLRSDPTGRSWLAPELYAQAAGDERFAAVLREHIDLELAMAGEGSGRAEAASLFTREVMAAVPRRPIGTKSMRRTVVLAASHALAVGVGYLLFAARGGGSSGQAESLSGTFHGVAAMVRESLATGGVWLVAAVGIVAVVATTWPSAGRVGPQL